MSEKLHVQRTRHKAEVVVETSSGGIQLSFGDTVYQMDPGTALSLADQLVDVAEAWTVGRRITSKKKEAG